MAGIDSEWWPQGPPGMRNSIHRKGLRFDLLILGCPSPDPEITGLLLNCLGHGSSCLWASLLTVSLVVTILILTASGARQAKRMPG